MRLAIFFNSKTKVLYPKMSNKLTKKGVYSILKIPHYTIFLLFISYYIPVPTFLLIKLCKKKNPKNLSLVLLYLAFVVAMLLFFLTKKSGSDV